jgi:hypothetical protein
MPIQPPSLNLGLPDTALSLSKVLSCPRSGGAARRGSCSRDKEERPRR